MYMYIYIYTSSASQPGLSKVIIPGLDATFGDFPWPHLRRWARKNQENTMRTTGYNWLVVLTILNKNEIVNGKDDIPYGKKHVWNHQQISHTEEKSWKLPLVARIPGCLLVISQSLVVKSHFFQPNNTFRSGQAAVDWQVEWRWWCATGSWIIDGWKTWKNTSKNIKQKHHADLL